MNDHPSYGRPSLLSPVLLTFFCGIAFLIGGLTQYFFGWWPGSSHVPHSLEPTFGEAWNLVEDHYVDRQAVQPERMTNGAIVGMLDSLGDTGHTTYLTAKEYEQVTTTLQGNFSGIGARMTVRHHQPTIFSTVPGSPAATKLKPGDVLLAVDGKPVRGMPLDKIVQLVRGAKGTQVHLRILRHSKPITLAIERANFKVPNVTGNVLPRLAKDDPLLAHVAIESFGEHADKQLRAMIKEVRDKGAKGLVIDLRGDPGGEKDQAATVTNEFLPKGKVVFQQRNAKGVVNETRTTHEGSATTIPIVVLIDEGTASSAEILAAALKDNDRAKLVGTTTFGTGTVLGQFRLSDGSAVLLAVEEWLPPNGQSVWHKGVKPDVEVSLAEDALPLLPETEEGLTTEQLAHSTDKQLLKAIDVLTTQMKKHPSAPTGSD